MSIGIRCLLADDEPGARALAAQLDQLNVERRGIEAQMQAEALAAVARTEQRGAQGDAACRRGAL